MKTILTTPFKALAESEALAIKKALQKKGYVNVNIKIACENQIYQVIAPGEVITAMNWQ